MVDLDREACAREYEAGSTIRQIAARHDVSPATVRAELLRCGVTPRRRGGARPALATTHASAVLPSYGHAPT